MQNIDLSFFSPICSSATKFCILAVLITLREPGSPNSERTHGLIKVINTPSAQSKFTEAYVSESSFSNFSKCLLLAMLVRANLVKAVTERDVKIKDLF